MKSTQELIQDIKGECIEDLMLKWREEGMSWSEIDAKRKSVPYNKIPSRTHARSWLLQQYIGNKSVNLESIAQIQEIVGDLPYFEYNL